MGNCILGMGVGKCSIPYTLPNGNARRNINTQLSPSVMADWLSIKLHHIHLICYNACL